MRLKSDLSKQEAELEQARSVRETAAIEAVEAVERQLQECKQVGPKR